MSGHFGIDIKPNTESSNTSSEPDTDPDILKLYLPSNDPLDTLSNDEALAYLHEQRRRGSPVYVPPPTNIKIKKSTVFDFFSSAFDTPKLDVKSETELEEYKNASSIADEKLVDDSDNTSTNLWEPKTISDIDDLCIRSNSPFIISRFNSREPSREGSRHNSNHNSDSDKSDTEYVSNTPLMKKIDHIIKSEDNLYKFKKLTYKDVVKSLEHHYNETSKCSNELDILITFIRGQKNLFSQSSNITYAKLYGLLMVALSITAFVTVITPFIETKSWNVILITSCNAVATLIISLTRYLNLEFTGNAFRFLANNYEKFENTLELANNKLMFIGNTDHQDALVLEKFKELEFKIGELKDVFQVIIPNEIKSIFPVISHINIFSLIKKMDSHKKKLIHTFKDIKNEMNYITFQVNTIKYKNITTNDISSNNIKELHRVAFLNKIKEKVKTEILDYREAYGQLEYLFTKEIQFAETHMSYIYMLSIYNCIYGKPKYLDVDKYTNPVIRDYLRVILNDD